MDLKSFGKELAQIGLPLLGSILPIPGGAAIGTALAAAIGSPTAKPEDILATLTASADAVEKAKEFELSNTANMTKLHLDFMQQMYADEVSDRVSARSMQTSTQSWSVPVMAWSFIVGFFIVAGLKFSGQITSTDPTTTDLFTTLRDALMLILAFYFGSSSGSRQKDILLANSAPAK